MSAVISSIGVALGATAGTLGAFALGGAVVAGVGSMAYGAVAAHEGNQQQKGAMEQQKRAQEQALAQAQSEQRRSEMAQNAANRRQPSVAGIMERAAAGGSGTGTMLTGPSGVDPNALALGKNTLLGG